MSLCVKLSTSYYSRLNFFKCDVTTPCTRCLQVARSAKIFKQPCYRIRLEDVVVFRAGIWDSLSLLYATQAYCIGNARAGVSRSKLPNLQWSSADKRLRTIDVQYPFKKTSTLHAPSLTIGCQQFTPSSSDKLSDFWKDKDGEIEEIKFPPYACVSLSP